MNKGVNLAMNLESYRWPQPCYFILVTRVGLWIMLFEQYKHMTYDLYDSLVTQVANGAVGLINVL